MVLGMTALHGKAQTAQPAPVEISSGWQLQDVAKVTEAGTVVSSSKAATKDWHTAVVPGTVLTSLVADHTYPEPLFGENNRPERIPESLNKTSYWYRAAVTVPGDYKGHHIWLNFDGINYAAEVWVNGTQVGSIKGAFIRGKFDVTGLVKPGKQAVLAVLVAPQPHPGVPHEHTWKAGNRPNGGITAIDGPTFLSTIGWDWIPAIRDRDTGIWRKVFFSATGDVVVKDPLVTTDLPLPSTDSSDVTVQATVQNVTDKPQKGVLQGRIEDISFEKEVEIPAHGEQKISFDAKNTPVLHMEHPRLWWPNGYGPQNLYKLELHFVQDKRVSDGQDVTFGVRKITYSVPDSPYLTISVNGVRVFIRGGNWGLDEALKRIPYERLEAQIKLHKLANMNLIRNWVGQSTNEDLYELCDKYGILVWDEFFQPNPGDGPDVTDIDTYMANVRDKILRFRNHPSIMLWCARNEGFPPKEIDDRLRALLAELEPTRRYQPSSTSGNGVQSHGPYHWRTPAEFYKVGDDFFKTETGSMSIPTLESIHGMLDKKDWETIGDAWAEHDYCDGAQGGREYKGLLEARYGKVANLPDFVRKAQLMNYEAFRAMYEGRQTNMFHHNTAIITWMSDPAQPSFTWQIYHHDLEPNSSLFAVQKAGEMVHAQLNEVTGALQVINNLPTALKKASLFYVVYNLDGGDTGWHTFEVNAPASTATTVGQLNVPERTSKVYFIKLELRDADGKLLSTNFYWRGSRFPAAGAPPVPPVNDDLSDLNKMAKVTLEATVTRTDSDGHTHITVTVSNPAHEIALMTHVQLRRKSGERVLPVYYSSNYVSLISGQGWTINIDAATADLHGEDALVVLDGWNVTVTPSSGKGVSIAPNTEADPANSPVTGLPIQTAGLR